VPALAERHRVIVMDSRGHGRGTRNAQPYGYALMASDSLLLQPEVSHFSMLQAPRQFTDDVLRFLERRE
jgi:hypothetical protein